MDNESLHNKDLIQLQQRIIFLKSELAKYQTEITTLKESDYHSLVTSLEQDNNRLIAQKKELSLELMKLKKMFESKMNDLHEDIQLRESQRIKLVSSIEALVKNKNDLQAENIKLEKALKEAQKEVKASKFYWRELIETEYSKSVENIENTMRNFIENNGQQLANINDEWINSRNEVSAINQNLLQEMLTTSKKVDMLMSTVEELKEQNPKNSPSLLNDPAVINHTMLSELDNQVQKMFNQSSNFEAQLDEKLRILDDLEYQLIQLTTEIDNQ